MALFQRLSHAILSLESAREADHKTVAAAELLLTECGAISYLPIEEVALTVILSWYVASVRREYDNFIPIAEDRMELFRRKDKTTFIEIACMLIFSYLQTDQLGRARSLVKLIARESSDLKTMKILLSRYLSDDSYTEPTRSVAMLFEGVS